MRSFPAAFLANSACIVTHGGIELKTPVKEGFECDKEASSQS